MRAVRRTISMPASLAKRLDREAKRRRTSFSALIAELAERAPGYLPTDGEHLRALEMLDRYETTGLDLADAVVMAIAEARQALILTWDFRHFRAAAPGRRRHWPLLVQEHEMPEP